MNEYKTEWLATIMIVSITIGLIFLFSGCSVVDHERALNIECEAECEDCKDVKLRCEQNWEVDKETESQGQMSGPSIGG